MHSKKWYLWVQNRTSDKGTAHTGDIGIGRKPKNKSVWCPHSRGTNAETTQRQR
jgi:hypothetical protein